MNPDQFLFNNKLGWYVYNEFNILIEYGRDPPSILLNDVATKIHDWLNNLKNSIDLADKKAKEKNSHNSQRICSPFVFHEPASIGSHTLSMSFYTFIRVSWPRRRDRPPSRGFYFILIRLLERDNFEYKKCLC